MEEEGSPQGCVCMIAYIKLGKRPLPLAGTKDF